MNELSFTEIQLPGQFTWHENVLLNTKSILQMHERKIKRQLLNEKTLENNTSEFLDSGLEVLSHFMEGEGSLGFAESAKKQRANDWTK